MKSIRRLFMFLCCATLLCAACAPSVLASEAPLSIVCTIFPAYDFDRQLIEKAATLTPAQVQAVARKYLEQENAYELVLLP